MAPKRDSRKLSPVSPVELLAILCAHTELLKTNNNYRFAGFFYDEVFMRLASFPAKYCIAFLNKYDAPWNSYLRVCRSKNFWLKKCDKAELKAIFDAGIERFQTEGMLLKEVCLFWERLKDYDTACGYCKLGVERQLTDDTKGGFPRRLARLQNKVGRSGQDSKGQTPNQTVPPAMVFYFAAKSAEIAGRIIAEGFNGMDCVTVKLPYGDPTFVDQPGIIVSTELDPSTGFTVEIAASPNPTFLRRHELISPVQGVRYYVFFISTTKDGKLRRVSDEEIQRAKAAGSQKWQHGPLVWFGKE